VLLGCEANDPFKGMDDSRFGIRGDSRLVVMTYNIEDGDVGSGETPSNLWTYLSITQLIKEFDVDVVAFQEIQVGSGTFDKYGDGSPASDGDTSNLNWAFRQSNYIMPFYAFNADGGLRRDFQAVWSKFRIHNVTSIRQENGTFDPSSGNRYRNSRPTLRFRIRFEGRDIWFYGCHLKSNAGGVVEENAGNRRAQSFHLARYIMRNHSPENDLIVILGDMNTMPEDYDNSGNSTIDYLCLKFDNPYNTANDFIPLNLSI
jgi:endonuclease/exonuclease/phosphatase family metal-dependent hydrolase